MSRLLRRNKPCRGCRDCHSTEKVHRDEEKVHRDEEKDHRHEEEDYRDEDDGHDHRLDELRRALHHFTLGVEIPSDESEEEDTLGVDSTPSQSDKSEEEDHPDEEDDLGDPRLDELREALFALADCLSCSDDESEEEHGQSQDEA